jgi:hypothetical protein
LFFYSVCKVHIFATSFSYSTLLTRDFEKWKYGSLGETGEEIVRFITSAPSLSNAASRKYFPFS